MRSAVLICLIGLLALSQAEEQSEHVVVLTPDNYDQVVTGGKHALVEFYAPWCGHCKRLEPIWNDLATHVASDPKLRSRVVIAKVDADEHRSLGERYGVKGFPTIKFFGKGKPTDQPVDYTGGRSLEALSAFIAERIAEDSNARVQALDGFAASFLASSDQAEVLRETEAAAQSLTGEDAANGALYVRFMRKALEKGAAWVDAELARLEKVASSGKMSSTKLAEIGSKLSVLSAFKDVATE